MQNTVKVNAQHGRAESFDAHDSGEKLPLCFVPRIKHGRGDRNLRTQFDDLSRHRSSVGESAAAGLIPGDSSSGDRVTGFGEGAPLTTGYFPDFSCGVPGSAVHCSCCSWFGVCGQTAVLHLRFSSEVPVFYLGKIRRRRARSGLNRCEKNGGAHSFIAFCGLNATCPPSGVPFVAAMTLRGSNSSVEIP